MERPSLLRPASLHELIDRICIGKNINEFISTKKFRCFRPQNELKYVPYADDFGPLNFSCVAHFIEQLHHELTSFPSCKIVYCVDPGRREFTNAVFLLGCYMLLKLDMSVEDVIAKFDWLDDYMIEYYRDATLLESDFDLTLEDCWRGLSRGASEGWVVRPRKDTVLWGMVDVGEYAHFDDPLNADLHVVVPGKFVAFRGPVDLGPREYCDEAGYRRFSPAYYVDIFRDLGVTDVVRLNEPEYDRGDFVAAGIGHHDLYFDDCTFPPPAIVAAFLDVADAARGLVAVHCKAGLGRTGTLIALYLMRSCHFTAREAIGWLRIMRPGSVIGQQQRGLVAWEAGGGPAVAALAAAMRSLSTGAADGDDCLGHASQVAAGMERRCAAGGNTPAPRSAVTGPTPEQAAGAVMCGGRDAPLGVGAHAAAAYGARREA